MLNKKESISNASGSVKSILETSELIAFNDMSQEIITKIVSLNMKNLDDGENNAMMSIVKKWLTKVMRLNILGGKMLRGMMVPMTYKSIMGSFYEENKMPLAYALGWVLEILQAASLVADDIMDNSETRRGKPCWYKQSHVGLTAVNDCLSLEIIAFQVLKIYFENEPYYRDLYNTLHAIVFYTIFGQSLDCHTEKCQNILESYTMQRYDTIVKYKTSYYTTFMPVICGMIMAGKDKDVGLVNQVESIMIKIGHYFQVQDDYLDCFGNEESTGKKGTDIEDNKCSWLFVKAKEMCTSEELEILLENYGKGDVDKVGTVKKLYVDLGVKQAYQDYENEAYEEITRKIANLPDLIPRDLFIELLAKLYKRAK